VTALRAVVDDANARSFTHRMRNRRFAWFEERAARLGTPLRIIDIGGTTAFWEQRGWADRPGVEITLVNLKDEPQRRENITPTVGDACRLEHDAGSFDLAFSNSVIEHLFTFGRQAAMADEIRRVARAYWVQTPNKRFPMEPHFLAPGWQYLPMRVRVAAIQRWRVGQRGPCPDPQHARATVAEVRLLTRSELQILFPRAELVPERLGGLVKSWTVAYGL
jgi:hypothetical protein